VREEAPAGRRSGVRVCRDRAADYPVRGLEDFHDPVYQDHSPSGHDGRQVMSGNVMSGKI